MKTWCSTTVYFKNSEKVVFADINAWNRSYKSYINSQISYNFRACTWHKWNPRRGCRIADTKQCVLPMRSIVLLQNCEERQNDPFQDHHESTYINSTGHSTQDVFESSQNCTQALHLYQAIVEDDAAISRYTQSVEKTPLQLREELFAKACPQGNMY